MNRSQANFSVKSFKGLQSATLTALLLLLSVASAHAQFAQTHHMRSAVATGEAKFLNRLPATQTMQVDLVLPLRDPEGLDSFLQEVYDPSSPLYRHFLLPQQFTERFGPTCRL